MRYITRRLVSSIPMPAQHSKLSWFNQVNHEQKHSVLVPFPWLQFMFNQNSVGFSGVSPPPVGRRPSRRLASASHAYSTDEMDCALRTKRLTRQRHPAAWMASKPWGQPWQWLPSTCPDTYGGKNEATPIAGLFHGKSKNNMDDDWR